MKKALKKIYEVVAATMTSLDAHRILQINGFYDDDDEDKEEEPSELYNYKIPWSLRLAYAVNYSNATRQNEISSNSLMFSGDVELSPRWSVGASSGYDFKNQGFTIYTITL